MWEEPVIFCSSPISLCFSGQFLEELSKFSSICYKLRAKRKGSNKGKRGLLRDQNPREREERKEAGLGGGMSPPGG